MLDSSSVPIVGQIVPDYELLRCIGRGAYGEVWLARSKATGALRAAKIVCRRSFEDDRPYNREFEGIQRFERISREHPSQLALFHIGRNDAEGYFFYVMELADDIGPEADYSPHTLRADLAHGRLPVARVLEIGIALASALEHLHGQGLLHRDIKPSNIIFVKDQPRLADVGLITQIDDARSLVGTTGYIPPEGPGTPQADIYSLGKVLYEGAFGKDRQEFPKLPSDLQFQPDHEILLDLNAIILKACDNNPEKRYGCAEEIRSDLESLRRGKSVRQIYRIRRLRHAVQRASIWASSLTLAAVIAGAVFSRSGNRDLEVRSAIPEANALTDLGFFYLHGETPVRLHQAQTYFNKAVELDSKFVPARWGLIQTLMGDGALEADPASEIRRKLHTAVAKLIEAGPSWGEARLASSIIKWADWDFRGAVSDARSAARMKMACKTTLLEAHVACGFQLLQTGHPAEALEEYRAAEKLDAGSTGLQHHLGHAYFVWRRFDQAMQYYQRSLDMDPRHFPGHLWKGRVYEEKKEFTPAIDEFEAYLRGAGEETDATRIYFNTLRDAVRQGGEDGYWRKRLELALKHSPRNLYEIATLYARLNDKPNAYSYLRKACEKKAFDEGPLFDLCWDRTDPEFVAIVRGVGLLQ